MPVFSHDEYPLLTMEVVPFINDQNYEFKFFSVCKGMRFGVTGIAVLDVLL